MPRFQFGFRKSGTIGHVTAEQQLVLDRLQAGEITPDEAARELGGKAHSFGFRIGTPPAEESSEAEAVDPPPPATAEPRSSSSSSVIVEPIPWARMLGSFAAAFTIVLGVVVALADRTTQDHALTAFSVSLGSLLLFGCLAAWPGVGMRATGGSALAFVPFLGAAVVLDWGLLVAVTDHWSAYWPGVIWVGIGVAVVVCGLLVLVLVRRTRDTLDLLARRKRR